MQCCKPSGFHRLLCHTSKYFSASPASQPIPPQPQLSSVAQAIVSAASSVNLRPDARPKRAKSMKNINRLKKQQRSVFLSPTYRPPLLKTHYIPPHHIAPDLKYPRFPSPYLCAQGTNLESLVDEDEHHTMPETLPDKFAVFAPDHYKHRQFKVMIGDRVMISLLYNKSSGYTYKVGEKVVFDNVLCVASRQHSLIGRPLIPGAQVMAHVEEITQLARMRHLIKHKRNRRKKVQGHRPWVTILRIDDIMCDFSLYVDPENVAISEQQDMQILASNVGGIDMDMGEEDMYDEMEEELDMNENEEDEEEEREEA